MRGEYFINFRIGNIFPGSPPLAWGIHGFRHTFASLLRITPTCVGNTDVDYSRGCPKQDHPHLRGEYSAKLNRKRLSLGSPPLAWGIPPTEVGKLCFYRITPTCVGNTVYGIVGPISGQDHPHLRGEYTFKRRYKLFWRGSPPLAWGIL